MSVNRSIRGLKAGAGKASESEILARLLEPVTIARTGRTTYDDAIREGALRPSAVAALDKALRASGEDWLANALSGQGADISDAETNAILAALPEGESLAAFGSTTRPQWEVLGLAEAPTLAVVRAAVEAGVEAGRAVSISLRVTPTTASMSVAVQAVTADGEILETIEAFSGAEGDPRLTPARAQLLDQLKAIAQEFGHGDTVRSR